MSFMVCTALALLAFGAAAQAASFSVRGPYQGQIPGYRATLESGAGDNCITQSTNNELIQDGNSVTCNAGGLHTDNGFVRRFELSADHALAGAQAVSSVEVGIEVASGASGSQPASINLYSIGIGQALTFANMTAIGTAPISVANQALSLLSTAVAGGLDASTQDLVVEFFIPDGQSTGNSLFPGSNGLGQIGPSFIVAADCGAPNPSNLAGFGFPNVHWVQTVCLGPSGPVPALGPLGALLMIVALGGGSAYVARRRQA